MINLKELGAIIIVTIILGITLSLRSNFSGLQGILIISCLIFIVILINVIAKKVVSFFLDAETEIDIWKKERVGALYFIDIIPLTTPHPSYKFRNPIPLGIIIPILTALISIGYFVWMACLTFEVKPKTYRAAKRYGLYTFSEMTEWHLGLIAAWGIAANLIFAVIGYLIGFEEFARLNIYFAAFNTIPLSNLDGNKLFFGSLILWAFFAAIVLIGIGYALII
ncbi:MAG: hypothetical protein AABX48_02735 [Nanoarchaeota archaeon]